MTSFSVYKIDNTDIQERKENNLFGMEFVLSKKGEYDNFKLFEVKIKKDIADSIFIETENGEKEVKSYYKIFYLDIFLLDKYLIVKGNYEAREIFDHILSKKRIINIQKCNIDLGKLLEIFSELKSLSIKDFSANIDKLKATGALAKEDDDIKTFLERGGEITAITIKYPCGKDFINIHVKQDCSLRINDCEELNSLEEVANFIDELLQIILS